ncbi:PREDICTED: transmembrane protein C1orf162 homolog isoform X1 [Myotis brandtii]|uniref:transmembrane protein C1orf162 homolog isoform X1 n=1 Tax=Myotis brandtii TaxID=109478 RepID=UPI000703E26F|nr:PREDICTED: transmembrane protein C1orf162 homolog isoform X1 [Myotis brandtii]
MSRSRLTRPLPLLSRLSQRFLLYFRGRQNGRRSIQKRSQHCKELHLALAFLAGSLLTLLLVALVFFIIKSYRKYHSSPHALDPHSDSLAKLSSNPEEALTSASMALKTSKEKRDDLIANHSADLNSVIYAQIKLADSS